MTVLRFMMAFTFLKVILLSQNSNSSITSLSISNPREIMLWHRRLGHPIFSYLRRLFPSLFENKDITSFDCEMR